MEKVCKDFFKWRPEGEMGREKRAGGLGEALRKAEVAAGEGRTVRGIGKERGIC